MQSRKTRDNGRNCLWTAVLEETSGLSKEGKRTWLLSLVTVYVTSSRTEELKRFGKSRCVLGTEAVLILRLLGRDIMKVISRNKRGKVKATRSAGDGDVYTARGYDYRGEKKAKGKSRVLVGFLT